MPNRWFVNKVLTYCDCLIKLKDSEEIEFNEEINDIKTERNKINRQSALNLLELEVKDKRIPVMSIFD